VPSQNVGSEYSMKSSTVSPRSRQLFRRTAAYTPSGTPTRYASAIDAHVKVNVVGSASPMTSVMARPSCHVVPRLPVAKRQSSLAYCSYQGLSRS